LQRPEHGTRVLGFLQESVLRLDVTPTELCYADPRVADDQRRVL
jgi:hypothetical protein